MRDGCVFMAQELEGLVIFTFHIIINTCLCYICSSCIIT